MSPRTILVFVTAVIFVFAAPPALAEVDFELVAMTMSEEGYYIDSEAPYLKSDDAQDKLRDELDRTDSAFVAVLPADAGTPADLPRRLARHVNRPGTYIVLVGSQLRAHSTTMAGGRAERLAARSVRAHRTSPPAALVEFLRLMNGRAVAPSTNRPSASAKPSSAPPTKETRETVVAVPPSVQPQQTSDERPTIWPLIATLAIVLLGTVGGFLWWRRNRRTRTAADGWYAGQAPSGGQFPAQPADRWSPGPSVPQPPPAAPFGQPTEPRTGSVRPEGQEKGRLEL